MKIPLLTLLTLAPVTLSEPLQEVKSRLLDLIRQSQAEVGLAFKTLDGEVELYIQADRSFHAASTMKIPVMMELFQQARQGKLQLEQEVVVRNEFSSMVDGSPYRLDPTDDSEADLYGQIGRRVSLLRLCEAMITASSNLATNLLIELLGAERIQARVEELGAGGMRVLRGVEDIKAYRQGLNNTTTARSLLRLLEVIALSRGIPESDSRRMMEILKGQRFRDGIPSGLPPGIEVAHKTGEITRIHHDAAIVLAPRPFLLVILVEGVEDRRESARLMGALTRLLYHHFGRAAGSPEGSPDARALRSGPL